MFLKQIFRRLWYDPKYPRMSLDIKIASVLAETFGVTIYMYVGCMANSVLVTTHSLVYRSITFGLGFMISTIITLPISGAYLNPVVTLSAWMLGTCHEFILIPLYILGQLFGALIGTGLARASLSKRHWDQLDLNTTKPSGIFITTPNPLLSQFHVFMIEFILTFIMILTYACIWEEKHYKESVPLKIGLTITCLTLMGDCYSGASMNPARTFGTSVLNFDWDGHWIYWTAPISAAFVASLCWKFILKTGIETKTVENVATNTDTGTSYM